jgi:hypothetical protein
MWNVKLGDRNEASVRRKRTGRIRRTYNGKALEVVERLKVTLDGGRDRKSGAGEKKGSTSLAVVEEHE